MFGKIAKLFKRSAGKQSETAAAALPTAMPEPQPLGKPKYAVPGMEMAVETAEPVAVASSDTAHTRGDSIVLPFSAILQLVPKELIGKGGAGSGKFSLPKSAALEQLARGAVKVPFGDLRRAAPPGLFVISGTTQDSRLVDLPLREILNQLHPESFARRPSANRLTAPQEVTDLFGSKGERLTEIRVVDKSEIKAAPAARQTPAAPAAEQAADSAPEAPAAPIGIAAPNLAQQLKMPAPSPTAPSPALKAVPKTPAPAAAPAVVKAPASAQPSMSAVPKVAVPPPPQVPRPAAATLPPNAIKFPSAPTPAAVPTAVPAGGALSVSVNTVSQKWPEAIRAVIQQLGVTDLEIPNSLIETSLKTGKIEFSWQQVVSWLRPAPAGDVALDQAGTVLDLPLSVIAPLFLQQSKYKAKQSSVPAGIPDLFSSKGEKLEQEEPEEEAEVFKPAPPQAPRPTAPTPRAAAPAPAPAPAVAEAPAPAPAAAPVVPAMIPERRKAQNLSELFGEPNKKNWTPNEIVHKTIVMPGITGALIALQDGLLVAGCMPPPWKTETIAAFIPQIFGRLTQYTKELQMGEVRTVSFGVETGTLQIFNAGIIYFGALGKQGESLPVEDLTLIASELSRHTK